MQSGADFGDDAEAEVEVCEKLVGEAAVSVSYVNARPKWPVAAGWKALLTQNNARTSRLQNSWCRRESD